MYPWIWRRLPGGLLSRLTCSAVLLLCTLLLLWFVIFPWLDTLAPFNDVTVH